MKLTREQLHAIGYRPDGNGGVIRVDDTTKRPSTPTPKPKLNNLERRWLAILTARHPKADIIPQFRLRVGRFDQDNPVHYTADYAVFHPHLSRDFWHCTLWECKDKRRPYHSDELTRPKMVRENNPFVAAVYLAVWDGANWEERKLA